MISITSARDEAESTPVASSDEDKRRRAELAKELGYFPATLFPEIERHRRLNAALDAAPTPERSALGIATSASCAVSVRSRSVAAKRSPTCKSEP